MNEHERVIFAEESTPQQYLRLVASGNIDAFLLDALDDYVKRQRKRLQATRSPKKDEAAD